VRKPEWQTDNIDSCKLVLAQRIYSFVSRLSEEIAKVNVTIAETEKRLDNRITNEIAGVRNEIASTRANLIKWMFIFWFGQVITILGILFVFFKKSV